MDEQKDHNSILLRVLAHDLLAPLTALKWQTELLVKEGVPEAKRIKYIESMQDSVEIGIVLAKHAYTASSISSGKFTVQNQDLVLPESIEKALKAIRLQYERHGLTLEYTLDPEKGTRSFDGELLGLLVWSIAKFFLSCAPTKSSVSVQGLASPDGSSGAYTLITSVAHVPQCEMYTKLLNGQEYEGVDAGVQVEVFASLLKKITPILNATCTADVQNESLVVDLVFLPQAQEFAPSVS